MPRKMKLPTNEEIQKKFEKAYSFNQQIGLYDQVMVNENFFIGNQWEGVEANGLPTPTFNMFKRILNFQVSNITSDKPVIRALAMPSTSSMPMRNLEKIAEIVSQQFSFISQRNRLPGMLREFLRNAGVTGDGCIHCYFDPTIENGQDVKGEIVCEVIDNLRVMFGNPNCRDVQKQPYIIISRRELVEDVRWRAENMKEAGLCKIDDVDSIKPDSEKFQNKYDAYTDDKVTVLTYYFRNRETKTISLRDVKITATDISYVQPAEDQEWTPSKCVLTTSFPKIIYDRTKVRNWDGRVGTAVGVQGPVEGVAKILDGASISPQISQFLELVFDKTHSLLGASDVAMGDSRPDNTSAIIALQRAANTPMEATKHNAEQCLMDLGRIWQDIMTVKYGIRYVSVSMDLDKPGEQPLGMDLEPQKFTEPFDFASLKNIQLTIEQEAGGSTYWSEIASMQTLDNLFMNKAITAEQYVARVPNGYIVGREELLAEMRAAKASVLPAGGGTGGTNMSVQTTSNELPVKAGGGNGSLYQRLFYQKIVENGRRQTIACCRIAHKRHTARVYPLFRRARILYAADRQ